MKRLFTTWLCPLSCYFFFSVKAKKNGIVSFCYPKQVLQLAAWDTVDRTYQCSFHQSLFPIKPAQLFFINFSPYLLSISSECIKPLSISLTFHIVILNLPSFSYTRSNGNYRQLAELKKQRDPIGNKEGLGIFLEVHIAEMWIVHYQLEGLCESGLLSSK